MASKGKVLVVGGLGYFGCVLSDVLSKADYSVDIVDCCLFDNKDVKESIEFENLFVRNIIDFEFSTQYDKVIWSSDLDVDDFYVNDYYAEYLKFYRKKFKSLVKQYNENFIYITSFYAIDIFGEFFGPQSYKKFVKKNCSFVRKNNGSNIILGSLYGPSPRMRWDTFVNAIIFNYLTGDSLNLMEGWLQEFPICSVASAASHMKNLLDNIETEKYDDYYIVGEVATTLELAYRLRLIFEDFDKEKKIIPIRANSYDYNTVKVDLPINVENNMSIEQSCEAIIKGLEQMHLTDFENDKYNNELFIDALSKGLQIMKDTGFHKWLLSFQETK